MVLRITDFFFHSHCKTKQGIRHLAQHTVLSVTHDFFFICTPVLIWMHSIHIKCMEKIFTCCDLAIPFCACYNLLQSVLSCSFWWQYLVAFGGNIWNNSICHIWLGPNSFWKPGVPETCQIIQNTKVWLLGCHLFLYA